MIYIYTDGACEPINPGGTAGWGVHIHDDEKIILEASGMIEASPTTSNNVAEYMAFYEALKFLLENKLEKQKMLFRADSNLVVKQSQGKWRIREGRYVPLALECKKLFKKFKNAKIEWIPREKNSLADELSKRELIKRKIEFRIQPND